MQPISPAGLRRVDLLVAGLSPRICTGWGRAPWEAPYDVNHDAKPRMQWVPKGTKASLEDAAPSSSNIPTLPPPLDLSAPAPSEAPPAADEAPDWEAAPETAAPDTAAPETPGPLAEPSNVPTKQGGKGKHPSKRRPRPKPAPEDRGSIGT